MKTPHPSRNSIEDSLIISILLFAPLALASVHTWAWCAIAIVSLIVFNLHFLNNISAFKKTIKSPIGLGLLLFLGISILYIVPLPAAIIKVFSPATFDLRSVYAMTSQAWQPLSLYPHATVILLVKGVSYTMIFLTVFSKIAYIPSEDDERMYVSRTYLDLTFLGAVAAVIAILFHSLADFNLHIPANAIYFAVMVAIVAGLSVKNRENINTTFLEKIVDSVIIIGFIVALFGIIYRLSGNGKMYWIIEKAGAHFGPYINYDHYAGYMSMCACLAVAHFMAKMMSSSFVHLKRVKDKIIWFSSQEANSILIYLLFSIVMTTALFLTTSRGGILSFAAAILTFFCLAIIGVGKRKRNRILFAIFVPIALIFIMICWVGPEATMKRFRVLYIMIDSVINEGPILGELRPKMWKDTAGMIKDFPIFGVGPDVFSHVFPGYRTFEIREGFLRYPHNDYLQLISEMGIFGAYFIIAFYIWFIKKIKDCVQRMRKRAGTVIPRDRGTQFPRKY